MMHCCLLPHLLPRPPRHQALVSRGHCNVGGLRQLLAADPLRPAKRRRRGSSDAGSPEEEQLAPVAGTALALAVARNKAHVSYKATKIVANGTLQ